MQVAEPMLKSATRCNLELVSLTARRAQAYFDLPATFARCRTPQDLASEQVRFWQAAASHYTDSGRRIAEAWSEMLAMSPASAMNAAADAMERDFITFPEPHEDSEPAPSRRQSARRAA